MISDNIINLLDEEQQKKFPHSDNYICYQKSGNMVLDGHFTLEELEFIVEFMKKYGENK